MSKREQFEDGLLDSAIEGLKHINAFMAYEGDNPKYLRKAKVAAVPVVTLAKVMATRANEATTRLVARRMDQLEAAQHQPKRITK